jgi:lipid II:glycine glycyltransferase (peptidoglycan interpeptide bridge formation enzyme)
MFVAYDNKDNALASRLVIPDAPFVYDWLAGSSEQGDNISANHTLVARIMEIFAQEGYSTFDFRGANTPGVIEFKRAFGGLLISYTEATFRGSRLLRIAEALNSTYMRFKRGT